LETFSYLKSINADYLDQLLEKYQYDPDSVETSWRYLFDGLHIGRSLSPADDLTHLSSEAKVAELINAYRELGRLIADLDPLQPPANTHPLLELERFGLSDEDQERVFTAGRLIGLGPARLADILQALHDTYCRSIGVEFTHLHDPVERDWLRKRMEATRNRTDLPPETRKFILSRLSQAEGFERFLHTRYVAQKRFSLEGGESALTALDCIFETGAALGAREFVLGMAHRGRLNVLTNVFGKDPAVIFVEFEGNYTFNTRAGEGDVKYHMGYSCNTQTRQGSAVHLSLASNPSHLEHINPVIQGMVRAKQSFQNDKERTAIIPVAIHGDAAFAGQGICYETLNLAGLKGFTTGGTIHLVINNQIGFTALPSETRSTTYATDLAKMLEVPIFHVNGDDPEAVWHVASLATEYRQNFKKDVFIDVLCYRRHGHNEGDEPAFTQPLLYSQIKAHPTTRTLYAQHLQQAGLITDQDDRALTDGILQKYSQAQTIARTKAPHPPASAFEDRWKRLQSATSQELFSPASTQVPGKILLNLAERLNQVPSDFTPHPKLIRFLETRSRALRDGVGIDWGNAEALAFGSLLLEGNHVRLTGQDAERGTFSHRHAVLRDFRTNHSFTPLNHLGKKQGFFEVTNSHLSEAAVLGFEYGYSLADPQTLTIWEAQFGDFANTAQAIIDQFISSSESKWRRSTGIVLLLPHGHEGQGPEHSSARLERFLQLCGKENMQVCDLTTPAQFFHALRRQVHRDFRKPLVIMSPKSMLRHPQAVSTLPEFTYQGFQEILDDPTHLGETAKRVTRLLLCSGKIYYDLALERTNRNASETAILRLEQLYPFPEKKLTQLLARYPKVKKITWLQEEPRNMGAWTYIRDRLDRVEYIGREPGAAPAVGSGKIHEVEQQTILEQAFQPTSRSQRTPSA